MSDVAPVFGTVLLDVFGELSIFLGSPWPFYHRWIQNLLPTVKALNVGSLVQKRCYLFPVSSAKFLYKLCKLLILLSVPVSFGILRVHITGLELIDVLLNLSAMNFISRVLFNR